MYRTQNELKSLLLKQYGLSLFKCFGSLILVTCLMITIPLYFRSVEKKANKIINTCNFIGCFALCIYAYVSSNSVREYGGKVAMLQDLEKKAFIQENLITQERYLSSVSVNHEPLIIDQQSYHCDITSHHSDVCDVVPVSNVKGDVISQEALLLCSHCGSDNVVKNGLSNGIQRYKCNDCHKTFMG